MNYRIIIAVTASLFATGAYAAGPFDGDWHGLAKADKAYCGMGEVTVNVADNKASGEAKFPRGVAKIGGVVAADGSINGTIGLHRLTGLFKDDSFAGGFSAVGRCDMTITLTRGK
ncbi:MAG: hypothetical protein WAN51_12830 [Alphaproteobacteria bacterium]